MFAYYFNYWYFKSSGTKWTFYIENKFQYSWRFCRLQLIRYNQIVLYTMIYIHICTFVWWTAETWKIICCRQGRVTVWSKVWICGRSLVGIAGSNPAGGMVVFLLCVLYVAGQRLVRRTDHSSRGDQPSVVCLSVILKPRWWGGSGPLGAVEPWARNSHFHDLVSITFYSKCAFIMYPIQCVFYNYVCGPWKYLCLLLTNRVPIK